MEGKDDDGTTTQDYNCPVLATASQDMPDVPTVTKDIPALLDY